jgi:hypothetical protein
VERAVAEGSDDPVNHQWFDGPCLVSIESTKTAEA